ncbi:MAG: hypothetical protein GWN58_54665 [Anaerolineae bacterium]|nr:hypothetical protein [Anaerolineae bacterium]
MDIRTSYVLADELITTAVLPQKLEKGNPSNSVWDSQFLAVPCFLSPKDIEPPDGSGRLDMGLSGDASTLHVLA